MQLRTEILTLHLRTPFRIAHGVSETRQSVIVYLEDAVGEAALAPYYGVTPEHVIAYLSDPRVEAALDGDLLLREDILDRLPPGPMPARAALDVALHDFAGKRLGAPLYRLWGLNPGRMPRSSFTISQETDEAALRQRLHEAADYPILKLKLGTGDLDADLRMVRIAREATNAQLCVDANAGWSVDEAADIIPRLAGFGLLFVEQPLARDDIAGWHKLRARLPADMPPLIADESAHMTKDIPPLAGAADGVNIKLAKSGGLREAWRMVQVARAFDMKVMLGCMVESAVGVTAAGHLAPLVDFADLDGNLLVSNDPFDGLRMRAGELALPNDAGLGVKRVLPSAHPVEPQMK